MAGRREPRRELTARPRPRIMVLLMTRVTVRTGGLAALAMIAAVASGCRSRPLDGGGSGTISLDAGGASDAMVDGATDRSEPRRLGESCDRAADCESGFCGAPRVGPSRPGICCNTNCEGTCGWCDPSGTCVFVPNGQKPVG